MAFCTECGNKYQDNQKFCSECGNKNLGFVLDLKKVETSSERIEGTVPTEQQAYVEEQSKKYAEQPSQQTYAGQQGQQVKNKKMIMLICGSVLIMLLFIIVQRSYTIFNGFAGSWKLVSVNTGNQWGDLLGGYVADKTSTTLLFDESGYVSFKFEGMNFYDVKYKLSLTKTTATATSEGETLKFVKKGDSITMIDLSTDTVLGTFRR